MKITIFVEGMTEEALPVFFKRWLSPRLPQLPEINVAALGGAPNYLKEFAGRSRKELTEGAADAVVGLLDLYGCGLPWPDSEITVEFRYQWGKRYLEQQVGHPKFRQHFAVHETEAWLLCDSSLIPNPPDKPEEVNFDEPPSRLLTRLYRAAGRKYKKKTERSRLCHVDPELAYSKCPYLKCLLDDLLELATAATRTGTLPS